MTNKKAILVHACCASCSSYVLAHLAATYDVTAYFFNPNIHPESEYELRLEEMKQVCETLGVRLMEGDYRTLRWWKELAPFKDLPEKSERCWTCYRFRLESTAKRAVDLGMGLFTTTLSVSPHKVHERIVSIGNELAATYGLDFLSEDFKKSNGFKISIERSKEMKLTRQDYCGCLMSLNEARKRKNSSSA